VNPSFEIAGRRIGADDETAPRRCFVIAEAGVNHNGDPEMARRLVDAAATVGADAVKFQTFDPDALAAADAPKAEYQMRARSGGATQREMLRALVLPPELHLELQERAEAHKLVFLSSPFDEGSADFLDALSVPAYKIPSGELTNHPFLAHVAAKHRPLLVSTGMSTLDEVRDAVEVIRANGAPPLALFHCVSSYPARPEDANLRAMATLREAFNVPVGWSDHTPGIDIAIAAVALGADLIEKHLTLNRDLPGPDHRASLDPRQMADMIAAVRHVTAALGDGVKKPVEAEAEIARVARKSLHFAMTLPAGTTLQREHFLALRPGTGVSPARIGELCGRVLPQAVSAGELVPGSLLGDGGGSGA